MNACAITEIETISVTDRSGELASGVRAILDLIRCVDAADLSPCSLSEAAAAAQSMMDEIRTLNGF